MTDSPPTYNDRDLLASFDRFVVFNTQKPRNQVALLALDEEHAAVEGANALALPRHRVAVVRTPGFLDSLSDA